jgi:O-succinylhomoserine sulfhydrylase
MTHKTLPEGLHPDTLAMRAAVDRSQYGENSEALYLTSGYVQPTAEAAHAALPAMKRATPMGAMATPR